MIPKGILEREKWLSAGMLSQDFGGAIAKVLMLQERGLLTRSLRSGFEMVLSIELLNVLNKIKRSYHEVEYWSKAMEGLTGVRRKSSALHSRPMAEH